MLHLFFKWRYKRKSRAGSFRLPKERADASNESVYLGSYLSQDAVRGRGFKPFDLPRKRRKWMQIVATVVGICVVVWICYESILALALIGN